jgi:hypothetical protein
MGLTTLSPVVGLIIALAYQYYQEIPSSYKIKVMGVHLTDHVLFMALVLQFSILSGLSSLVPAFNGLATGILISCFKPLRNYRLPKFVNEFCLLFLPSDPISPPNQSRVTMQNKDQSNSDAVQVNDEDLSMLESMGFERNRIIDALKVITKFL